VTRDIDIGWYQQFGRFISDTCENEIHGAVFEKILVGYVGSHDDRVPKMAGYA